MVRVRWTSWWWWWWGGARVQECWASYRDHEITLRFDGALAVAEDAARRVDVISEGPRPQRMRRRHDNGTRALREAK